MILANSSNDGAHGISGCIVVKTVAGGEVTGEPMIVASLGAPVTINGSGRETERRRCKDRDWTTVAGGSRATGVGDDCPEETGGAGRAGH